MHVKVVHGRVMHGKVGDGKVMQGKVIDGEVVHGKVIDGKVKRRPNKLRKVIASVEAEKKNNMRNYFLLKCL
ncbi:hypothetical protein M514_03268 [Trichuris suis]|uniref:Uncharacterized protein n=1 Tax=Trichuris suis TaxID=68888 RepID=A0A085NL34_9BILA|nr:hypothetical protein M513_03268 [Trichuris suis]KFD70180.1 hypothetical protein M514_03268 [Trichuris suis]